MAQKCFKPVFLLYSSCFGLFVLQMSLLIHSRLHPEKTISSTEQRKLREIPFPVVFRVCIKPAYNQTFLEEAGYKDPWYFFTGFLFLCPEHLYGWRLLFGGWLEIAGKKWPFLFFNSKLTNGTIASILLLVTFRYTHQPNISMQGAASSPTAHWAGQATPRRGPPSLMSPVSSST